MKPKFEKVPPRDEHSFRCIDRRTLKAPVKWHRHPEVELTYVETGSGTRLVGDHIGPYTNHDLVLLGSNLPHTWASDEFRGKRYDLHPAVVILFQPGFLGEDFFEIYEVLSIKELLNSADRGLWYPPATATSVGKQMTGLLQASGPRRLLGLLSILTELSESDSAEPLASAGYTGPNSAAAESRIKQVCDSMQEHFTKPEFAIADLADMLQMNQSAFSRFFKQATERTPTQYLNELRVGYACRQLIESDKQVLEICYESGFDSASYFNRMFKRLRGTTPRQYRSDHNGLGNKGATESNVALKAKRLHQELTQGKR